MKRHFVCLLSGKAWLSSLTAVFGLLAVASDAADVPRNFTVYSGEAVTGSMPLAKTGAGTLSLVNYDSNTFSGDITVEVDSGTLKVGGQVGAIGAAQQGMLLTNMTSANTILVKRGSTFFLEDNATATIAGYATNRFGYAGNRPALRLAGGTFYFNGANVASLSMTQTLGTLLLDPGPSALTIVRAAGTPQLIFTNLVQSRGSYLTLTGVGLGTTWQNVPQVLFAVTNSVGGGGDPGTRTMSIVPGMRLGSDLVYNGSNGLRALVSAEYYDAPTNDINLAGPTDNVRITNGLTAAFTSLSANKTINSLVITNTVASTWLMSNSLTLTSGQLLSTPATAKDIRTGALTAGSGSDADLDITAVGPLTIAATITDNGAGAITLVKNGAGTLTLTNNVLDNTYSGGTVVNEGGLTLAPATNVRFLGSGPVLVDNAVLTMYGIGATANGSGDDYTAINGAQIAIGNVAHTADDTFNIGGASILSGATGNGVGLNSLDRGIGGESAVTNIVLAPDSIIGQPALVLPLNPTNGTIRNPGTGADLYYGLGAAQASALGVLGIGGGTPWKGISTLRAVGGWNLGTINVGAGTSDIYFQGLAVPGLAPYLLTIGNTATAGGPLITLADAGTVNANVLGAVTVDDDAAVFGDTGKTVNFVVKPGATLTFNQPAGMGSGAGIATARVQEGGTLAAANPAAFNGAVTVEAGGRLLANMPSLSGSGALTFNAGSILDITAANGFSGPQARTATVNPGTIVRLDLVGLGSAADPLDGYLADKSPVFEVFGVLGWPLNPAVRRTILTLNRDAATGLGGLLVNDSASRAIVAVPNGVIVIGSNGATIAATTNTILTIPQAIDLGANALTIGATNKIDGILLPKIGTVQLTASYGLNTALPGSSITVEPGAVLGNILNSLPPAADLTVNGTFLMGGAQIIGSLAGSGMVSLGANALTIGANTNSRTFSGALAGSGAIVKTGSGRLDITSAVTNNGAFTVNGGTLALSGGGQTTNTGATAYTVVGDGVLQLDNSGVNMTNRLAGAAPGVTFQGGTFRFTGKDGEGSSELLGAAAFNSGASRIDIVNGAGAGSTAQVTFSAAAAVAGTVNFTASNGTLGLPGENPRVLFTGLPTGLVAYATVGNVPAWYETATGIRAYTLAEGTEFDGTVAQTLMNTKYTTANNHQLLTAARTVNSLWVDNPGSGYAVDLGSSGAYNLTLTSGRLWLSGTDHFEVKRGGTSTAVLTRATPFHLYLGVDNPDAILTMSVPIANTTGSVEKDGPGTLLLNATNTFTTGGLTINAGTVKYGANADLATTAPLNIWGGGKLDFAGMTDGVAAVTIYQGGITNSGSGGGLALASLTMGSGPAGSASYVDSGSGYIKVFGNVAYNTVNDPDKAVIAGGLDLTVTSRTFTVGNSVGAGAAVDMDVSAVVTGISGVGIVKAGLGTLRLSGSNTFDGAVSIGNTLGTVILANPQALGTPSILRTNIVGTSDTLALENTGAISDPNNRITLNLNGTGDPLLGAVSGALASLAGNNNVPCAIILAATGTQIASLKPGDKLTLTGPVTGAAAGLGLVIAGEGDTDLNGTLATTTGTLTKNGGGTLTLGGTNANTFTGTTTVNGGKVLLDKTTGAAIPTGAVILNNGAVLQYAAGSANPNLMGTAGMIINGSGMLDFNGATDTIGNVSNVATLATADTIGITNSAGGGSLTLGLLAVTPVAGYLHRIDSGSGTLTLTGNVAQTAATTGRTKISGNLSVGAATRIFTIGLGTGPDYDMDIDAVISGAPGAGLSNVTGRLRLSAPNTYPGDTTLTSGTLKYGVSNAIPSGAGYGNVILTAGTLELNGFSPTINGLSGAGAIDNNVPGLLTNVLTVGANDQGGLYSGVLKNTTGTVALVKIGAGLLTLSGANTYSGDTTVNAGRVKYGAVASIPSGAGKGNVTVNGSLDLNALSPTVNGLNGSGIIDNGAGAAVYTLTVGGNNQNGYFSGTITNSTGVVAVTKSGTGVQVFSGANSYSGATAISVGTLNIRNGNALGWTNLGATVTAGATLELQGDIETPAEALSLSGVGVASNGALRNISGTNVYGGLVTLAAATRIQSDAGLLRLSHPGVLGGAFGLTVGGAGDAAIQSVLGIAAGTLLKVDSGVLTLSGSNTFTGGTTVNGGRLFVANTAGSGTGSGAVTVNAGGAFGGNGLAAGAVTVSNGAALTPGLDGQAGGPLTVGRLTLQTNSILAIECAASPTNDSVVVTNLSGLSVYGGGIYLYEEGTTNTWSAPGTYPLIRFTGAIAGSVTNLVLMNPVEGRLYNVGVASGWIVLTIGDTADQVWNGASADDSNWQTASNWASGTAPLPNAVLTFAGASRTDASNNYPAGTWFRGLAFDATAAPFTLGGNAIRLTDSLVNNGSQLQTINVPMTFSFGVKTVNGSGDLVLNGAIDDGGDSNGFIKAGSGTLTLTASNSFSAPVVISNGAVVAQNAFALGMPTNGVTVFDGASLRLKGGFNVGVKPLVLNGQGTNDEGALLNLQDVNGYAGPITLAAPAKIASDAGTLVLDVAAGSSVTGAQDLVFDGAGNIMVMDSIATASGRVTKAGAGMLTLMTANLFTGGFQLDAGALAVSNATALGTNVFQINGGSLAATAAALTVANRQEWNGDFAFTGSQNLTLSGAATMSDSRTVSVNSSTLTVSGVIGPAAELGLTKAGPGVLVLSTTNAFAGLTRVGEGTLRYGIANALSNGPVTVDGGTLDIATLSDTVGTVTMSNGAIIGTTGILTGLGGYSFENGLVTAILAGTGTVTKTTAGLVTMSAANTFTGSVHLMEGTLRATNSAAALGAGLSTLNLWGGELQLANNTPLAFGRTTFLMGDMRILSDRLNVGLGITNSLGPLNLGSNTLTVAPGDFVVSGLPGITFGSAALSGDPVFNVATNGTDAGMLLTLAALHDGGVARTITKAGPGTLILSTAASNLVLGTQVKVAGGRLHAGAAASLGTLAAIDLEDGAVFSLGAAQMIGALSNSNAVESSAQVWLGGFGLTVGNNNQPAAFSGVLSGSGTLIKGGAASFILSGANTFTGLTTVSSGNLNIRHPYALGSTNGNTVVNNAAALEIQGGIELLPETITLNGTGLGNGGALRNMQDDNIIAGLVTLGSASRIQSDAGSLTLNHPGAIAGAFGLVVGGSGDITINSVLGMGAGSLTKNDSGTLTLTASNTFAGGTTINAGTLNLFNAAGSGAGSGPVTVNNGGTLTGVGSAAGSVTNLSGGAIVPGLAGVAGGQLAFGRLVMQAGSSLLLDLNTIVNDQLVVTNVNGLTLNGGSLYLYDESTGGAWASNGTYNLIQFNGTLGGSADNLTVANPAPGKKYVVRAVGGWIKVIVGGDDGMWNGASLTDDNWSTGANWLSGVQPEPLSTLIFGGTNRLINVNDYPDGTGFNALTFHPSAGPFVLNGNRIALAGTVLNNSLDSQTVALPVTLSSGNRIWNALSNSIAVTGAIDDGAETNGLVKTGPYDLVLSGDNTYRGQTIIGTGTLVAASGQALGSDFSGTVVSNFAVLRLEGGVVLASEPLRLTNNSALVNGQDDNAFNGPIALVGSSRIRSEAGQLTLGSEAAITGAYSITFGGAGTTVVNSVIGTGAGSITNYGPGTVILGNTNTFSGAITLSGGTLQHACDNALANGSITMNNVGTLWDIGSYTDVVGAVTLNMGRIAGSGSLAASSITFYGTGCGPTNWRGTTNYCDVTLTGSGTLTKGNSGSYTILSSTNTYTGRTTVQSGGILSVNNLADGGLPSGIGASSSDATNLSLGGQLEYTGPSVSCDRNMIVAPGAFIYGFYGKWERSNQDEGSVVVTRPDTVLTLTGVLTSEPGVQFNGSFPASFFFKFGAGTLELSNTNQYVGSTAVREGILRITGSLNNSNDYWTTSYPLIVGSNAFLSGSGLVKPDVQVNAMGRIAPGKDLPAGTVLSVGRLILADDSEAAFQFSPDGATNDSVSVLSSDGLTLGLAKIFLYEEGTTNAWATNGTYRLIHSGGTIVGGGAALLTMGNPVSNRGYSFKETNGWVCVTISGGARWDGGGSDDNWMTAGNWESDAAPVDGDVLTFTGYQRTFNLNDYPSGTRFGGLTFDGDADVFTLEGNSLTLAGNLLNKCPNLQVLSQSITLEGGDQIIGTLIGDVTLYGVIDDAASGLGIIKTGPKTLSLGANNTYGGTTEIRMGTLKLETSEAIPHGPGKGFVLFTSADVVLAQAGYAAPGLNSTIAGDSVLDLAGYNETINGIAGNGILTNSGGSCTLTLDVIGSVTSSVRIAEGNSLAVIKRGAGMQVLAAASGYTGGTTVEEGELRVNNTIGSANGAGNMSLAAGSFLSGTGYALGGLLTLAGGSFVEPGQDGIGSLGVGDLAWADGAELHLEVTNLTGTANDGYDSLLVNGSLEPVTPGDKLVIRLDSLGQSLTVPSQSVSLRLITYQEGSVDLGDYTLDTNAFLTDGTWALTNIGHSLYAHYQGSSLTATWIGSGLWADPTNWSGGIVPQAGDTVVFDTTSVADCTAGMNTIPEMLSSITLASGYTGRVFFEKKAVAAAQSLVLSGDLTIAGGSLVLEGNPDVVGGGLDSDPWGEGYEIVAQNITVEAGASLNADNLGFAKLTGPGKATGIFINAGGEYTPMIGASHGGYGGAISGSDFTIHPPSRYGAVHGPTELGSGGFAIQGGGAVKLQASGVITINGTLSASCTNTWGTGGSGGSVWIAGGTLEGNGSILATGATVTNGVAGGGGRIDLGGTVNNFQGLLDVQGGIGRVPSLLHPTIRYGWAGSIALPASGGTGLNRASLTPYTNIVFGNAITCAAVVINSNVTVKMQAYEDQTALVCDSLTVTSNGHLVGMGDYWAINPADGGSVADQHGFGVTIEAFDIDIQAGGSINADATGFQSAKGFTMAGRRMPFSGPGGSGAENAGEYQAASYGGQGGVGHTMATDVSRRRPMYGTTFGPTALGSGGEGEAYIGGGALKVVVGNAITVDGRISADSALAGGAYGGPAGGSVWITGGTLQGTGRVSANGGYASATSGGGGRVDVSGTVNNFTGVIQAEGGRAYNYSSKRGQTGSVALPLSTGSSGAVMDNFVPYGTNFAFGNSVTFNTCVVTNGVVLTLDANEGSNVFTFTSLTIESGGVVRCLGNVSAPNAAAGGSMTRILGEGVTIIATNIEIRPGGILMADGSGMSPGIVSNNVGLGAYGGYNGAAGGVPYGTMTNVSILGSGTPGAGGGAIRLIVPETLIVDGSLTCDGAVTNGGSGGSVLITCGTLMGEGVISARGAGGGLRVGGGGGRIHLVYDYLGIPNPLDDGLVTVAGGGTNTATKGAGGTVFITDRVAGDPLGVVMTDNDGPATNSYTPLPNEDLALNRVVVRENGTLVVMPQRLLTLSGGISNASTFFAAPESVVAFTGVTEKVVFGNPVFDTLLIDDEAQTVRFAPGSTNTVIRSLVLNNATLGSTELGQPWHLICLPGCSQDVGLVTVRDSHARGGQTIVVTDRASHNEGNNANWRFPPNGVIIMIR